MSEQGEQAKTENNLVPQAQRPQLMAKFASRFGVEAGKMSSTLKSTAFRLSSGEVSDAQLMALVIVADQYGLNPFTKEIFAFPDKGGIVPVVGVDGWSRIVNSHPEFNGVDFKFNEKGDECTCTIWRRDREHPTVITEYLAEVKRDTAPWKSHPRRMLRHKAFIQCARIAFSYSGIYDEDEAERIIQGEPVNITPASKDTDEVNRAILGKGKDDDNIIDVEPEPEGSGEPAQQEQPAGHVTVAGAAADATVRAQVEEKTGQRPPGTTDPATKPAPKKSPAPGKTKHTVESLEKQLAACKTLDDVQTVKLLALDHLDGNERSAFLMNCAAKDKEFGADKPPFD